MATFQLIWSWLMEHGGQILAIIGAIISIATIIAALTPTPKDDVVIGKIKTVFLKILDFFKIGYPKYDEVYNKEEPKA